MLKISALTYFTVHVLYLNKNILKISFLVFQLHKNERFSFYLTHLSFKNILARLNYLQKLQEVNATNFQALATEFEVNHSLQHPKPNLHHLSTG